METLKPHLFPGHLWSQSLANRIRGRCQLLVAEGVLGGRPRAGTRLALPHSAFVTPDESLGF